ncbi:peptidoglycan-binding domain-containing protein [Streptomyces sp. NPDC051130]|uniref:peptidoglycan-binding domain-containing protein n=1 Tax=Streptomyces sp. NPDC051130 TaxID=3157223 RepID=UPI0034443A52
MSAERCPECDAPGAGCGCAAAAGFDPLRIRPYVNLSETGQAGDTGPSPQPVLGAVARPGAPADADADATELLPTVPPPRQDSPAHGPPAAPHQDTPAYGTPVAPRQDSPAYGTPVPPQPWPDHTVPLRAVPRAPGTTNVTAGGEGGGGGGGPEKRRKLPLLLAGAAALVAVGGVAAALGVSGGSGSGGTALLDAKPSAPVVGMTPGVPSQGSPSASAGPSASASASASPSSSASRSPSPSASPSASRSSASPSRTPSPTPSRTSAAPPPPPAAAQGPTLRYGDSGPEVKKLQQLLSGQGLYRGRFDGRFGKSTEDAVSEFQWYNNITADPWGVYGPATRKALEG